MPIRAGVDIKVGGTRCDLIMSKLQPWLQLHGGTHGGTHTLEQSKAADIETIMWRGTVSTPDMTVILYGLDDLPMYHVSNLIQHNSQAFLDFIQSLNQMNYNVMAQIYVV